MIGLNLIVLRTQNIESIIQWYSKNFGLKFVNERHGEGVLHYSAQLGNGAIEIYPTGKMPSRITFGFSVDKDLFEKIVKNENYKSIGEKMILLNDSDGNSIILNPAE